MSDVPSHKFLKLIKVSFDVSTSVVRDFADFKVIKLPEYGGSVIKFLDLKKHDLYHKWQIYKPCCCCGKKFVKFPKEIDKWRFDVLYETITDRQIVCMNGKGSLTTNGTIQQNCICKFIPRQKISLNEMDMSTLSLLLRYCNITPSQLESIQNLNKQRSRLCHAYSTRSLSIDEYDDILQNLENSTLELAMHVNLYYHRSIKENLIVMKSYNITTEESKKLDEKVMHELSEMQMENRNLIRNGFKTHVTKIVEAKDDIIQNQNTQFAELREQIQQLTAYVNVIKNQKTITTDNQCATSDENRDETSTEKSATSTQSKSYSIQTSIAELMIEQGAIPKRRHKERRQVHATCQVEGKDIDECSAVQLLPDTSLDTPSDLSFNIISAEQKCILLELEVPSKVLEDKILFRVALRALIAKIAHTGKIDINKESTITLHLTFKDDLTKDIMREMQELSYHSNIFCMIDGSLKDQQHTEEDRLKEKCAWLMNENVTLMTENSQLFKETFSQREQILNLKKEVEGYRVHPGILALQQLFSLQKHRSQLSIWHQTSQPPRRELVVTPPGVNRRRTVQMHRLGREPVVASPVEIERTIEEMTVENRRTVPTHRLDIGRPMEEMSPFDIGRPMEEMSPFGREPVEASHVHIGRPMEEMSPFVNRRRPVPAYRLGNRRERRRASPRDSGSESMDEYEGTVSDDESEDQLRW